jgi:hypothetical protein
MSVRKFDQNQLYTRIIQKVKTVCSQHLHFPWDFFFRPPYIPDLAPSDFHLFTHVKQFWGGMRMCSDEEMKKAVKDWFNGLLRQISTMQTYRNLSHDMTSA